MHFLYILLNFYAILIIVFHILAFTNSTSDLQTVPLLLSFSFKRPTHNNQNHSEFSTFTHSVILNTTAHLNSSFISPQQNNNIVSTHLLFFSPDVHDGTTTDLAVSLTSQGHSIFFYNGKAALPAYSGLRSKTLRELQYLQLNDADKKSRIIFAPKAICKKSKLFAYNMNSVRRIWSIFHNDKLFRRVDAIICMFYPSECQNYLAFNKTVIFMPAHRFLIKRCTLEDSKSLMKWMFNQPKAPVIVMAAGKYDAEYINYYSGQKVNYIYASTVLMYSPPSLYSPKTHNYLFAPFKKNPFYKHYSQLIFKTCKLYNYYCPIVNIRKRNKKYFTYSDINSFKAVVVFPYAVLSYYLADLVTAAIPMFVPSPSFIVGNKIGNDMKARDPFYCGKRFQEPPKHPQSNHFYSPEDYSREATEYWLQYASYYTPCTIVFNNITHLVKLMKTTNYSDVYQCNLRYRKQIVNHNKMQWEALFRKIEVNRPMPETVDQALKWFGETSFY